MCGIAGFSLSASEWLRPRSGQVLVEELLTRIEVRGRDATGMAWRENDEFVPGTSIPQLRFHKAGVEASTYMLEGWHLFGGHETLDAIIHTRAGTGGSPTVKENNHPIIVQQAIDYEIEGKVGPRGDGRHAVALVHNGVIFNAETWFREHPQVERMGEVDTEALAQCLALGGVEQVVKEIKGDAAIAWMDQSSPSLYVARLGGRPLEYLTTKGGSFLFASTATAVDQAHDKAGLSPAVGKTQALAEGEMLEILHGEIIDHKKVGKISSSYSSSSYSSGSTTKGYWEKRDEERKKQQNKDGESSTFEGTSIKVEKHPVLKDVSVTRDNRTIGKVLRRNGMHIKCEVCKRAYACLCDYNEYPLPNFPKDLVSYEKIPDAARQMNGAAVNRAGVEYVELNGRYYPRDKFDVWAEDAEWLKRPVWRVLAMDLLVGDGQIEQWYRKFWKDPKNRFGGDRNWYWMNGRFFARIQDTLIRRDPTNVIFGSLVVACPTLHSNGGAWCYESPQNAKAQGRTPSLTAIKVIDEIREWDQEKAETESWDEDGKTVLRTIQIGEEMVEVVDADVKMLGPAPDSTDVIETTAKESDGDEPAVIEVDSDDREFDETWGYRVTWRSGLVSVIDGTGSIRHLDHYGELLTERETGIDPEEFLECIRGVSDVEKVTFWDAFDQGLDGTIVYPVSGDPATAWVPKRRTGNQVIEQIANKAWRDGIFRHGPHAEAHHRVLVAIALDEGLSDDIRIDAMEAMSSDGLDEFMEAHSDDLVGLFE